jgi:hypothetical protein
MKKVYSNPEISITQFNNQDSILLTSQANPNTDNNVNTLGIYGTSVEYGNWNK